MARPKPPEELIPVTYRLTRQQIAKVVSMGGVAWLRKIVSRTQASRSGRAPIEHSRNTRKRNADICSDTRTATACAKEYGLSPQQVRYIRRQHAA